ncbi:MAG: ABC transporter ATP-binding protein [Planctomycetota bacterium]|nr:ABC transporter ATP-binding protein [Planctomycetota bacterium]
MDAASVSEVHKSFGSKVALRGVSFRLPKCGVIGLLGPNGAGKSTMIRILAGVLQPDSGTVLIGGATPSQVEVRSHIGWLPEHNPLPLHRSVQDWVVEACHSRGGTKNQAFDALDRCDLALHADRPIGVLSKGWRQLVGLAAASAHQPEVLILDEPSTGMDPLRRRWFRSLLRELGAERSVLLSSHLLDEAERVCDEAILLSEGSVRALGPLTHILALSGGGDLDDAFVQALMPKGAE